MTARLRLADLFRAGARGVSRYTGTLLATFVVQSLVAAAAMMAIAVVLMRAFAHLPLFDEAVDGNLVALIACLRYARASLSAIAGIVVGALLLWSLASWFLAGGIIAVLAKKPEGRADTARTFGAGGAATYLAYVRLAVCALPSYVLALFAFTIGLGAVSSRLEHALTMWELAAPLALALLPAALLLHLAWTIVDYARIELALYAEPQPPSVVKTYARAVGFVIARPIALVHAALGWLAFVAIWIGYAYLAKGHPMYGAEGAVTLFVIRQGVSLARTAVRFGVIGGQVELAKTRVPPPRRPDAK